MSHMDLGNPSWHAISSIYPPYVAIMSGTGSLQTG
jgi:hypothetical protein